MAGRYYTAINFLVLLGLGAAVCFFFSSPKDYGPPPSDSWFRSAVLEQTRPVLVKFGAPWCGPCRMLDGELDQLTDWGPARVVKIDVESKPELARHYGVSAIPRLLLFKNGKVVGDRTGYVSAEVLRSWIASRAQ
jgi:thioredoxin